MIMNIAVRAITIGTRVITFNRHRKAPGKRAAHVVIITSDQQRESLQERAVPIASNRVAFPAERRAGHVVTRSDTREVARGERAVRVIVPTVS